jgi:hypothetical protein
MYRINWCKRVEYYFPFFRWLRVLFSREFSFLDTLVIWDAIFADSCPPGLVDQVPAIFRSLIFLPLYLSIRF